MARGTLLQGRTLKGAGSPLLPNSVVSDTAPDGRTGLPAVLERVRGGNTGLLAAPTSYPPQSSDPSTITVGGEWESVAAMDMLSDPARTLVMVARVGTTDVAPGDYGVVRLRSSSDGGATWTAGTTIFSSGGVDCRVNISASVTPSGRFIVFLAHYDPDGSPRTLDFGYSYSDDGGTTWSAYQTIPMSGNNVGCQAHGPIVRLGDGRLMQGWYGGIAGTPIVYTSYVIFSSDDGATWGGQVQVATHATLQYVEGHYAWTGGSHLVGYLREGVAGATYRTESFDNGATWSAPVLQTADANPASGPLIMYPYRGPNGERCIAMYQGNRTDHMLRRWDCWADNVQMLPAAMQNIVGIGGAGGYPSAVHADGSPFSLVAYHGQSAGLAGTMHTVRTGPSRHILNSDRISANSPSLWIRASDLVAADASAVPEVFDRSKQGLDLVQATAGLQPVLKRGANGIGGRPAILFDGATSYLASAGNIDLRSGWTVFVVFRLTSNKDSNGFFRCGADLTDATSRLEVYSTAGAAMTCTSNRAGGGPGFKFFNSTGNAIVAPRSYIMAAAGGSTVASALVYGNSNGTTVDTVLPVSYATNIASGGDYRPSVAAPAMLGVGKGMGGTNYSCNGLIAELVVFPSLLPMVTIGRIVAQLNEYYGIW